MVVLIKRHKKWCLTEGTCFLSSTSGSSQYFLPASIRVVCIMVQGNIHRKGIRNGVIKKSRVTLNFTSRETGSDIDLHLALQYENVYFALFHSLLKKKKKVKCMTLRIASERFISFMCAKVINVALHCAIFIVKMHIYLK